MPETLVFLSFLSQQLQSSPALVISGIRVRLTSTQGNQITVRVRVRVRVTLRDILGLVGVRITVTVRMCIENDALGEAGSHLNTKLLTSSTVRIRVGGQEG